MAVGWALGKLPPWVALGPTWTLVAFICPPAQGSPDHPWPWACLTIISFQSWTLCPYIGQMLVSEKRGSFLGWNSLDSPPSPYLLNLLPFTPAPVRGCSWGPKDLTRLAEELL